MSRKFPFLSEVDRRVLGIFQAHPLHCTTSTVIANSLQSCKHYPHTYLGRLEQKGLIEVIDKTTTPHVWKLKE